MEKQKGFSYEEELKKAERELFPSFKTKNYYQELLQACNDGDVTTYIHLQVELEKIQKQGSC